MRRHSIASVGGVAASRLAASLLVAPITLSAQVRQAGQPEDVGLSRSALARIAPAMQFYIDSGYLSGMVLMIARHGRVAYSQTLGYSDIDRKTPMPADALFRLASMRKPIFAAAAMKLVEQGKIRLDDPVAKYIPAFADVQVYVSGPSANPTLRPLPRQITLEDLLTHTAGMSGIGFYDHPVDSIFRRAGLLVASQSLAEFVDTVTKLPLMYPPGTRWAYSVSIDVMNRVLEIASGKPLDQYLAEAILAPVGMRETSFHVAPDRASRLLPTYARRNGELRLVASEPEPLFQPSGRLLTYLISTPADYLRFCQMLLNKGESDGRRVLSQASVDAMLHNRLAPSLVPIRLGAFNHNGYGFGIGGAVLVDSAADGLPGSPGIFRWAGASGVFFWIDPKADLIAMLWTQTATPGYAAERAFQRLVYEAVVR